MLTQDDSFVKASLASLTYRNEVINGKFQRITMI